MDRRTAHCGGSSSGEHCSLLLLSHSQIAENIANLTMSQFCQLEYVSSDSDVGIPCDKRAVTTCADCGVAICSGCRMGMLRRFVLRSLPRLSRHNFLRAETCSTRTPYVPKRRFLVLHPTKLVKTTQSAAINRRSRCGSVRS
jgi:hypothetical protein